LTSDPDFASNPLRVKNRARLNAAVEAVLLENTAEYWIDLINGAGIPCGPVHSLAGVFDDPQIKQQQMALDIVHPGRGAVRVLGFPMKFSQAPCQVRYPAPDLGQHTAEVLAEIGLPLERRST
jgi:crotonobetainyl-CoA:carnitine CoA-transferase CaiB-like acyl-CoA transferase